MKKKTTRTTKRPVKRAAPKKKGVPQIEISENLINQLAAALQKKLSPSEIVRAESELMDIDIDSTTGKPSYMRAEPDFRDSGVGFGSMRADGNINMINTVNDVPFTKDNWLAMNHLLNTKIEALANRIQSLQKMQQFSGNSANINGVMR